MLSIRYFPRCLWVPVTSMKSRIPIHPGSHRPVRCALNSVNPTNHPQVHKISWDLALLPDRYLVAGTGWFFQHRSPKCICKCQIAKNIPFGFCCKWCVFSIIVQIIFSSIGCRWSYNGNANENNYIRVAAIVVFTRIFKPVVCLLFGWWSYRTLRQTCWPSVVPPAPDSTPVHRGNTRAIALTMLTGLILGLRPANDRRRY